MPKFNAAPELSDQDKRYYGISKCRYAFEPEFKIIDIGPIGELIEAFNDEDKDGEYEYLYKRYKSKKEVDPIIVTESGHIIDGWHRTGAAAKARLKSIPAFVVEDYGLYGENCE